MSVMKRATLLLLLLTAVSTSTSENVTGCDNVNQRLPTKDLHLVVGDWVLVWSIADHQRGWDLLPKVFSSLVELRSHDNKTLVFTEKNLYRDNSCETYVLNISLPADPTEAEYHTLDMLSATLEKDGAVGVYNSSAVIEFYASCPDCLILTYKDTEGRYLLSYRRKGHHQDVEQLKADHSSLKQKAQCLGFSDEKPFVYDGSAGFCPPKAAPEAASDGEQTSA